MKVKTMLFDFDGTLADTLPVCFHAFQEVFHKYDSRPLSKEDIIGMFGPSEVGIIEQNLHNRHYVKKAIEDYYDFYDKEHTKLVNKNTEILELIRLLQEKGIQYAIVTGKARRSYEISIKHLFPTDTFHISITGDDVIHPKPHPEGIMQAMKRLSASTEETLYIGDSTADIQAGLSANLKTVGVNWLSNSHGSKFVVKPPHYEFTNIADFIRTFIESGHMR
ncbi:HAD family hydrolase [Paenibacillus sp. 1001270B_150601_E10]|uniref:HAD family hydrolase n=1 Tax=Paenibacillus sp. 1001270B_150601_E10 TaxID=2787079 RepID=UPI001E3D68B6|nr:HAD family hydrolase [Paenibacillus sp. 1001270B_150601_E10]